jgi:hypothetical protein
MIFTGFTDVNGNVIPVQGAGTVYNEEKNSLALGKDTVAIGQDQLVFGRKNVQDANKVEVVGGGAIGSTWRDVLVNMAVNESIIIHDPHTSISIYESSEEMEGNVVFTKIASGGKTAIETALTQHFGETIKFDSFYSDSKYSEGNVFKCSVNNLIYVITADDTWAHKSSLYHYVFNLRSGVKTITAVNIAVSVDNSLDRNATSSLNIRTLDWQGNQWNAGDITCDDGNGNTISMRDLLSRIATLEAAAANS